MSWLHRVLGKDGSSQVEVDATFFAERTRVMPLPYGSLGHYRTTHRTVLLANQAANSRVWEIRNKGSNLVIPTRFLVKWYQTAASLAAEHNLDVFRVTGLSSVDTTNTATPVASPKKATMAAAPGNVDLRGLTAAGNTAGMTGWTVSPGKDGGPVCQIPVEFVATLPTTPDRGPFVTDVLDDVNGTHQFALANNEGLEVELRTLIGATHGSTIYIDFSYAEVPTSAY